MVFHSAHGLLAFASECILDHICIHLRMFLCVRRPARQEVLTSRKGMATVFSLEIGLEFDRIGMPLLIYAS